MSKIALSGNASGTGTLTIAAPNTNSDYTLTLPVEAGTVLTSGGAIDVNSSAPADSVVINSSGNVSVGVNSTSARFQVDGSGATSAGNTVVVRNSAPTNLFVIRNDGYFQTGTAAASPYNATTGSGANCFINSDGGLYRSTSSLKYKQNVEDATHGLNELLLLRSVTYQGKSEADEGKTFGGLVAEEVHEAGLTEFVQYADDGSPDALAYGNMVSLCIKSIQELKAELDTVKAELADLKGQA